MFGTPSLLPRVLALFLLPCAAGPAAVFTVTTTNDTGAGSLRQAIASANNNPGQDTIQFNLPGTGVQTIAPLSALPDITGPVTINGYTQTGSQANTLAWDDNAVLRIRLDGSYLSNSFAAALTIKANNCVIRGLIVVRFPYGLQIDSANGNVIAGNWIGLDWDNIARGMTWDGIKVTCPVFATAVSNVIGGPSPADRNIVSGNREGITVSPGTAANNSVVGNFVGTDRSGRLPRGNLFSGIRVQAATNITVLGNVLASSTGAGGSGISLQSTTGCVVQQNRIGIGADLATDLGNFSHGLFAQAVAGLLVGDPNAPEGNFIGCNRGSGLFLQGCTGVTIGRNRIGSGATGGEALGNAQAGIYLTSSSTNLVVRNEVYFNGTDGISLASGLGDEITANAFYDNAGMAIDLNDDNISPNDPADTDTGANELQNYPILTSASLSSGVVTVNGSIESLPMNLYRIEFYAADPWDPLGSYEGRIYMGAKTVFIDPAGLASFQFTASTGAFVPQWLVALAIDPVGNTSEFSPGIPVVAVPAPPVLTFQKAAGSATLSWPATGAYELQSATSLAAGNWSKATNTVVANGGTNYVTVADLTSKPSEFFRLIQTGP